MDHNRSTPTEESSTGEELGEQISSNLEIMGTGRSYECVFCKRGFTTAQALGGHMNIHRKDRVKTNHKPTATTPSPSPLNHKTAEGRFSVRPTGQISTTTHHQPYISIPQSYLPTSSTWCLGSNITPNPNDAQLFVHNNPSNASFKENWSNMNMSLTSPLPTTTASQSQPNAQQHQDDEDDDHEELDLELRLGHDR